MSMQFENVVDIPNPLTGGLTRFHVHNADALVCAGGNQHLVDLAKRYELLVWEV